MLSGGQCTVTPCQLQSSYATETREAPLILQDSPPEKNRDQENAHENKEQKSYEDGIKRRILEASLPFVNEHGWSKNAISAGAESLGYPGVVHGMFPRGGAELVQHFYVNCNQDLTRILKGQTDKADKSSTKEHKELVCEAVEIRLRMITPYLSHWPQAIALMSLPPNVPTSLANLLTLVDDICYYAGDRSVDFRWYARRIALAGIYKMTELYMIQDSSPDHKNTWTFLTNRINEATQLHQYLLQSESATQMARDVASTTFITARNMLGLNWNR